MSDSLRPHGLQHTRLLCPPLSPRICSNSCPLTQGCYLTTSSFVTVLLFLHSIFPSIGVFSNKSALRIRWPKYWSFSIRLSNEYPGLISFRIDWFDLLAAQGTLKSLLQNHNSKTSIHWCSAFFMVWLSHLYMTTGKTMALTILTFVGKVMSLHFKMLSRFVIAFLPRSRRLLISWLQSLPTVILESRRRKSVIASTFPPSVCHEVMGPGAIILVFWMLSFKPAFSLSSFTLTNIYLTYLYIYIYQIYKTSHSHSQIWCMS